MTDLETLRHNMHVLTLRYNKLCDCNDALVEALSFYADEANWKYYQHEECFALDDRGKRAREVLGRVKGEDLKRSNEG